MNGDFVLLKKLSLIKTIQLSHRGEICIWSAIERINYGDKQLKSRIKFKRRQSTAKIYVSIW